jgi:beta-lactam-binding protein with PASTA domain
VARGRVVAQKPAPGLRLARGARVRVVLSRGRR